ncbi:MAG: hypothetical protein QF464_18975, partial [Myxococcota bacterium]|nr:hypothetical protein [Myxococcota bacterium]
MRCLVPTAALCLAAITACSSAPTGSSADDLMDAGQSGDLNAGGGPGTADTTDAAGPTEPVGEVSIDDDATALCSPDAVVVARVASWPGGGVQVALEAAGP